MIFLIFGIIDLLAGIAITFSNQLVFPTIAKYVGMVLIIKGAWTIITALRR